MIATPKKATTVILFRECDPEGFEVFLLKRHEKSSFMGGNFVYPGGRVDREDGSLELCSYSRGITFDDTHRIFGRTLPPEESFAHWITPEARSERFDTRFFLASHPEGQEASYDQKETTEGIWIAPRKALEENSKGKMALSPPTLKTLEDFSRFETVDDVFISLKKDEICPILPILTKISGEPTLLFPWDPEYEVFERGNIPSSINHGRPSQSGDNTTRLILRQGIWYPYYRTK